MSENWRITVYDVAWSAGEVSLGGGRDRFIYVKDGFAEARQKDGEARRLSPDEGLFLRGEATITGEGAVWVYEIGRDAPPDLNNPGLLLVMSRMFALEAAPQRLLRADRIESQPGAATPRHGHRGPGMRRLVKGRLMAEIGDNYERIDAGHAWFETGRDPVIGTNIHDSNSAFVRVMVLPIELAGGKSSFMPTTPEDALKPRSVLNRLFGEVTV